jgi:hypothetical protein
VGSGSEGQDQRVALPDCQGDIVYFYVIIYVGIVLPVIGVGLITQANGLLVAVEIVGYVVDAACLLALAVLRAEERWLD